MSNSNTKPIPCCQCPISFQNPIVHRRCRPILVLWFPPSIIPSNSSPASLSIVLVHSCVNVVLGSPCVGLLIGFGLKNGLSLLELGILLHYERICFTDVVFDRKQTWLTRITSEVRWIHEARMRSHPREESSIY